MLYLSPAQLTQPYIFLDPHLQDLRKCATANNKFKRLTRAENCFDIVAAAQLNLHR